MKLEPYLKLMAEKGGSDLFFTTGAPICMNIEGAMRPVGKSKLMPGAAKERAYSVMDVQQQINFAIKDEFEKRRIEFAYPTQTLYVNKTSA